MDTVINYVPRCYIFKLPKNNIGEYLLSMRWYIIDSCRKMDCNIRWCKKPFLIHTVGYKSEKDDNVTLHLL